MSDAEWGVFLDSRVMPEVDDDPRYHRFQPTLSERGDKYVCLENKREGPRKWCF